MDMRKKDGKKLLARIKDRYDTMYDADQENRREAMEDMKFVNVPGYQWEANMKQERGKRPCYEFNKLRVTGKRIINDMRANRPSAKVRAVEGGDVEVAEINEGLARNICNVSDFETVTDVAAEYQVNAGMGAWRVTTEYASDTAFEQDIVIEAIRNPFTLYCSPSARDYMKRDAEDWMLTEKITYKAFEEKYGKDEQKSDFQDDVEFDDDENWQDEETVRIAEYWWKEPVKKTIWQVQSPPTEENPEGKVLVVDSTSDEAAGIPKESIINEREVMSEQIKWCVASGQKILEGPTEWAGPHFPFVIVYGEHVHIDGRPYWWGLPRFAKDAQRSYNISRTAIAETIAMAPQAKWWATAKQAEGLTNQWAVAHKKNLPFMLYNADPQANGPPQRMGGADVPIALIQESQQASEEIKAVTGIFDASMGMQGNEKSGRAIYARQQQGEIATFNFQDNMSKGVQLTYEIILGLIPEIYDTERELRILGSDGAEDYVKVNQVVIGENGVPVRVNDMAQGKYDVTITVGPNFTTQRQEAAETYMNLTQGMPEIMGVAGDLVFKSMDLPYAEDIADRLKHLLPPEIQQSLQEGQTEIPPEVQQAMMQADQAMQQAQEYAQLAQAAGQEVAEEKSEVDQSKADLQTTKAEVRTEIAKLGEKKALFDAHVAEVIGDLSQKEIAVAQKMIEISPALNKYDDVMDTKGDVLKTKDTLNIVDDLLANFMASVDEAVGSIAQKADRKVTGGTTRREGGKLTADVQYDDGSSRSLSAVRKDGQLQIEPEADLAP